MLPLIVCAAALHFEALAGGVAARSSAGCPGAQNAAVVSADGVEFANESGALKVRFSGSHASAILQLEDRLPGVSSYFRGGPQNWRSGIPHFARVRARSVYRGIDVLYYGQNGRLEFDFLVSAEARTDVIRMDFPGAHRVSLNESGDLLIDDLIQRRPRVFQAGRELEARYTIGHPRGRGVQAGIAIESVDASLPLRIDPVLEFQTYLGGNGNDYPAAVALDADGNIYIAGATSSTNFPASPGAPQATRANGYDVFVTKLNPGGTAVIYSTYIGSSGDDSTFGPIETGRAIAVDRQGNAYITGTAFGPDFPVTAGAYLSGGQGFALKLDSGGTRLVYSAMIGPATPAAIAVDSSGAAFIAGRAESALFRGSAGSYQSVFAGGLHDGFLLALNPQGSALQFATLLGGSGEDAVSGMALEAGGNVHVVGYTYSKDFPVTAGALQPSRTGNIEAFVAMFDRTGSRLLYSTFFGETQNGVSNRIAVDAGGSRYLLLDNPPPSGPAPTSLDGLPASNWISRVSADGSHILWSSSLNCSCGTIALDDVGGIHAIGVSGYGVVSGGAISVAGSGRLVKISGAGDRLLYETALPGFPFGMAVSPGGVVTLAGYTSSREMTTTAGAIQPGPDPAPANPTTNAGDGFVTSIDTSDVIANNFLVSLPAGGISISYRSGDVPPQVASIDVTSAAGSLPIQASFSEGWLTAHVAGTTPTKVALALNPAVLQVGKLSGTLSINSPALNVGAVRIPVTASITAGPTFAIVNQQPVSFQWQAGLDLPSPRVFDVIVSPPGQYSFVAGSDSGWVSANVTPNPDNSGKYVLRVFAGSAQPGTYSGTLAISIVGVPNSTQTIPVQYTVLPAAAVTVSPASLQFRWVIGTAAPAAQVIQVSGASAGVPIALHPGQATADLNCRYELSSQVTPATLKVSLSPNVSSGPFSLTNGLYGCPVGVGSATLGYTDVGIAVFISHDVPLDVAPAPYVYAYERAFSTNNPTPIAITGNGTAAAFTARSDQAWLRFPDHGEIPGIFSPDIDTTMPEGTYNASIAITPTGGGSTVTLPVSYHLSQRPQTILSTNQLTFAYRLGDPPPPPQSVSLTSNAINPSTVEYILTGNAPWMTLTGSEVPTPAKLQVAVDPKGLVAGTYQTLVRIAAAAGDGDIGVNLMVSAPTAAPAFVTQVVNAGSFQGGAVAPGEIVTVFGGGLGPAAGATAQVGPDGLLSTTLSGTQVLFDGIPAPLVYTSPGQLSAIVPYELAGRAGTTMEVRYQGNSSAPTSLFVAAASPAVFTANSSGAGACACQNYRDVDGGFETNSPVTPVSRGGIAVLYATGEGNLNPVPRSGSIAGARPATATLPITVLIGGKEAEVLYAGPVPGSPYGLFQINLRVPDAIASGAVPVLFKAGPYIGSGVTIAVR